MGARFYRAIRINSRWQIWLVGPGTRRGIARSILIESFDLLTFMFVESARWIIIACMVLFFLSQCTNLAKAASIPADAKQYRAALIRTAHVFYGLDAPVAVFAAQIHAESCWKNGAVSPVGARGMAQFMPATSRWIAGLYPHLAENEPHNPAWAMRALVTYDKYLFARVCAVTPCNRWAKTLSAYNGGLGWVRRDERRAAAQGFDPALWWGNVEAVNAGRSASSWKENRAYPRRILLDFAPLYQAAGWGSGVACE